MDKTMQETNELRDEELYALLDKAMEDERLCVSEDLIQKTLQRVKEEKNTEVIPFEKKTAKKYRFMKYAGAAAAAVLVLVVGVKLAGGGKFTADNAQMEAEADYGSRKSEDATSGIGRIEAAEDSDEMTNTTGLDALMDFFYSVSDDKSMTAAEDSKDAAQSRGTDYMGTSVVPLSSGVQKALADAGYVPVGKTAECWEYVQREVAWEDGLQAALEKADSTESEQVLSENGAYGYALTCANGSKKQIGSAEPLEFIVRIETEQGVLWCLFGDTTRCYIE